MYHTQPLQKIWELVDDTVEVNICKFKENLPISSVFLGGSNRGEICGYGEIRSVQS